MDFQTGEMMDYKPLIGRAKFASSPWALGLAVTAALIAAGCRQDGMALAPVEGVVLLDGQPVAEASVTFVPVAAQGALPAMGTTDSEGRFTLVTANRPGALIGEHRVAISKAQTQTIPQRRGLPKYKWKHLLPEKFASFETSGLTASVADDDNELKFELSSE